MDEQNGAAAGRPVTKPADRAARSGDGVIRMRVEGTYLELDVRKMDGLEMRTIEQMTGLPYAEAGAYAERGSTTAMIAFLYVAFARAGSTVGTPDEFLREWSLERIEGIERLPDPTPAEPGNSDTATDSGSTDSALKGSDATGVPGGPVSMASVPGNPTD